MTKPKHDTEAPKMLSGGIVVDNWKLPVFRKQLRKAGYTIAAETAWNPDITVLKVKTTNIVGLQSILQKAQQICASKPR